MSNQNENELLQELFAIEKRINTGEVLNTAKKDTIVEALQELMTHASRFEEKNELNEESWQKQMNDTLLALIENELFFDDNYFDSLDIYTKIQIFSFLQKNKKEKSIEYLHTIKDQPDILGATRFLKKEKMISFLQELRSEEIKKIILNAPPYYEAAQKGALEALFDPEKIESELPDWKIEIFLNFAFYDHYHFVELFYGGTSNSKKVVPLFEKTVLAIKPEKLIEKLSNTTPEKYKQYSDAAIAPIKEIINESKEIDILTKNENPDWKKIFEKLESIEKQVVSIPIPPQSQRFAIAYFKILKQEARKKIRDKFLLCHNDDHHELWKKGWSISEKLEDMSSQKEEKEQETIISESLDFILKIEKERKDGSISEFLKKQKRDLARCIEKNKTKEEIKNLGINNPKIIEIINDFDINKSAKSIEESILKKEERSGFTYTTEMKNFLKTCDALSEEEKKGLDNTIENLSFVLAGLNWLKENSNDPHAAKTMKEITEGLDKLKTEFEAGQKEWSDRQKACFIAGAICVVVILIALSVVTAGFAAGAAAALYAFIHSAAGIAVLTAAPVLAGIVTVHTAHKEHKEGSKPLVKLHASGTKLIDSLGKEEVLQKKKPR